MNQWIQKTLAATLSLSLPLATFPPALGQDDDEDDELFELSPFTVDASGDIGYGASAGGAQDINYARAQINLGNIPHPSTFSAEGLFSEHDLPLKRNSDCDSLLCVFGEAMPAQLLELPEAVAIGQIGFNSGLKPDTWSPPPLNLVAVVDKSGSMSGQPLELVKKSLLKVLKQMDAEDQLSIVLYGDRSHLFLAPTRTNAYNQAYIKDAIKSIESAGSTNMEAGLEVGYEIAESSSETFDGVTRLMLFTDERPNVGNTSARGFMSIMKAGSRKGIGLTTIGVGVQFGAELATKVSSVRGGNLFYFPDRATMVEKFENEFATMVTELAYDMKLRISPHSGYKIAGVYGVPADLFEWGENGSVELKVQTLFLSLRQGAMYFALAKKGPNDLPGPDLRSRTPVSTVELQYKEAGSKRPTRQAFDFKIRSRNNASLGLSRGENLINQYLSLKAATEAHHTRNDQESAYQKLRQLSSQLRGAGDPELDKEIELVTQLQNKLALMSGHRGEPLMRGIFSSPLTGNWLADPDDNESIEYKTILNIHPRGYVEFYELDHKGNVVSMNKGVLDGGLSKKRKGLARLLDEREFDAKYAERSDLPNSFAGCYYTDVIEIEYKVKGSKLVAEFTIEGRTKPLKIEFKRARNRISV